MQESEETKICPQTRARDSRREKTEKPKKKCDDQLHFHSELEAMNKEKENYYFYMVFDETTIVHLRDFFWLLNKLEAVSVLCIDSNGLTTQNTMSGSAMQFFVQLNRQCLRKTTQRHGKLDYFYFNPTYTRHNIAVSTEYPAKFVRNQNSQSYVILRQKIEYDGVKESKIQMVVFSSDGLRTTCQIGLEQKSFTKIKPVTTQYYSIRQKPGIIQSLKQNKIVLVNYYGIAFRLYKKNKTKAPYTLSFSKSKGQEKIEVVSESKGKKDDNDLQYAYEQNFEYSTIEIIHKVLQIFKSFECCVPDKNTVEYDILYEFGARENLHMQLYIKPLSEQKQNILKSSLRENITGSLRENSINESSARYTGSLKANEGLRGRDQVQNIYEFGSIAEAKEDDGHERDERLNAMNMDEDEEISKICRGFIDD